MVCMVVGFVVSVPMTLPRMTQTLWPTSVSCSYYEEAELTKSFAPSFLEGCQIWNHAI